MKLLVILTEVSTQLHVVSAATEMAKRGGHFLHVLFLHRVDTDARFDYFFLNDLALTQNAFFREQSLEADKEVRRDELAIIRDEAAKSNIPLKISSGKLSFDDILEHSGFNDLIIVDQDLELDEFLSTPPAASIKDLLSKSNCPVLVLKRDIEPFKKAILTYDGSASSIFAMKLYSYILPEYKTLPTVLLSVNERDEEKLAKEEVVRDWLPRHFDNFEIRLLKGKAKEQIPQFIGAEDDPTIVVMGAYGRDPISRLFHESLANQVIKETRVALFVTHRE